MIIYEIWKPIPGFDGYMASNKGRIRSFLTKRVIGRVLSKSYDYDGYETVWTKYRAGARVHQLVLLAFEGAHSDPTYRVVNHKNGIKDDNRIENLEWCTISQNTQHAYDIGLAKSAKSQPLKVTDIFTKKVYYFSSYNQLSKICNVNRNTLSRWHHDGTLLYDGYRIREIKHVPKKHNVNKPFLKCVMSNYQTRPVFHNGNYYESVKLAQEDIGVSRGQLLWAIKKGNEIHGDIPINITKYQYANQDIESSTTISAESTSK